MIRPSILHKEDLDNAQIVVLNIVPDPPPTPLPNVSPVFKQSHPIIPQVSKNAAGSGGNNNRPKNNKTNNNTESQKENKSNDKSDKKKFKCNFCDRRYSHRSSMYKHRRACDKQFTSRPVTCKVCNTVCSSERYLKQHQKKFCNKLNSQGCLFTVDNHGHFICKLCRRSYVTRHGFLNHRKRCKAKINFKNMDEFYNWKLKEERNTFSYMSKKNTRKHGNTTYHYFHCNFRVYKDYTIRKTARRHKSKRPNYKCPAAIRVREEREGRVVVDYLQKHSHALSFECVKYHRWFKDTREYIKKQLTAGVSVANIKKILQPPIEKRYPLRKEYFITKRQIYQFKYNLERKKHLKEEDTISLCSHVKRLEDTGNVILFKLQNEKTIIGCDALDRLPHSNDMFIYGYQNIRQKHELTNSWSRIICVDTTHKANKYGFYLLNIVIPDEYGVGYPVAYFISSQLNTRILEIIFETLLANCSVLHEVHTFMADDDNATISAIENVFGKNARVILCKWHLVQSWRNQAIKKIRNPELLKKVINDLHAVLEQRDISKFEIMLTNFYQKHENKCNKFVQCFKSRFGKRVNMWAMCHRNFYHARIHTNILCESLHNEIKNKRLTKKFNKRIEGFVKILEEVEYDRHLQLYRRREFNEPTYLKKTIDYQHVIGMKITDCTVLQKTSSSWEVSSVTDSEIKYVVRCLKKTCEFTDICLKCMSSSCPGLCTHLYSCTCYSYFDMCAHIHKVHMFRCKYKQDMVDTETDKDREVCFKPKEDNISSLMASCSANMKTLNSIVNNYKQEGLLQHIHDTLKQLCDEVKNIVPSSISKPSV